MCSLSLESGGGSVGGVSIRNRWVRALDQGDVEHQASSVAGWREEPLEIHRFIHRQLLRLSRQGTDAH